ncbi:MAG: type II toxin-antitoxin system RelE/ParE family toxin [Phycisphaerales bacterium]|nr:type II toxin-antitoxin system RelE/ParE family toxin [Phycisphaerales bacterium]
MRYRLELMRKAMRDLADLDRTTSTRIITKLETLQNNLAGDVKRLTNFTPEYRLRVGDYRVLFAVAGDKIEIHRVIHRREAYRP